MFIFWSYRHSYRMHYRLPLYIIKHNGKEKIINKMIIIQDYLILTGNNSEKKLQHKNSYYRQTFLNYYLNTYTVLLNIILTVNRFQNNNIKLRL